MLDRKAYEKIVVKSILLLSIFMRHVDMFSTYILYNVPVDFPLSYCVSYCKRKFLALFSRTGEVIGPV